jgi:hypothetical protein
LRYYSFLLHPLSPNRQFAGIVRDTSGAVMPGVTVEAASPALIEKSRTVVTDGTGQYRIVDLKPGTYTVTFTLSGFSTVRREGIELTGAGVTTINADLRVGRVEETITVTGATPVVDTQTSTKRQVVLTNEVLAEIPATRTYGNVLAMVPGVQSLTLDVNSTQSMTGTATNFFFTSRGGRGNEGTVQVDGMNVGSAFGGGGVSSFAYDFVNAQEVQVTVAGGMGESDRGGPAFNIIPKTGGNTYSGSAFFSNAGKWSQGSNLDDDLRRIGITEPPGLIKNWDTNLAIGGPIKRDRLWFFNNLRRRLLRRRSPVSHMSVDRRESMRGHIATDSAPETCPVLIRMTKVEADEHTREVDVLDDVREAVVHASRLRCPAVKRKPDFVRAEKCRERRRYSRCMARVR